MEKKENDGKVEEEAGSPNKTTGQKRRRTRSHNSSPSPGRGFFVPGFQDHGAAGGSGHKMMSLSELMDAAKGVTNMYLAHEIAVDKDFRLEGLNNDDDDGSFGTHVRKIVHQAFWDLLADELDQDPPVFNQALTLLAEVRDGLVSMLMPNQHRTKVGIMERLDVELIRQQAENRTLNFREYADYVVDLMAKLCAPVRDDEVKALKDVEHVVPLFKAIMKTLDKMRMDLANFVIQQARPMIVSQSVEYEKKKFKEFLAAQHDDGLELTRSWLLRHAPTEEEKLQAESDSRLKKLIANRVINDAFVELLQWDDYHPLPETWAMDQKRIVALRDQTERTSVSTAVVLVSFSNIGGFVTPADGQTLKEKLKSHVDVLLQDFNDDTDLLRILPNVALQVVTDINEYLKDKDKLELPESTVKNVTEQIVEMEDPNSRIRDLVQKRLLDFNKQAISCSRTAPLQIPPGLTICQKELAQIAGGFVRLVSYNRAVFTEVYDQLIENHVLFIQPNDQKTLSAPK